MLVQLSRGQIGKSEGLDITRRTGGPIGIAFAPPWDLILQHKKRRVSWPQFTAQYYEFLAYLPRNVMLALYSLGGERAYKLRLLCYCPMDQVECHTVLCMQFLEQRHNDLFCIYRGN